MDEPAVIEAEATTSLDIEASPDDVWHALTTDDGLSEWLGENSSIGEGPGEPLIAHDFVTGDTKHGVVREFSPNERLGYTWWSDERPDDLTQVDITLVPTEVGTRVTVVERGVVAAPTASACAATQHASWSWKLALLLFTATSQLQAPR